MRTPKAPGLTLLVAAAAIAGLPLAGHGHDHHRAHVHGVARMQVAFEKDTAELILSSPAANLLGFEHQPRSSRQQQILEETEEWLQSNALIQTSSEDCVVLDSLIHRTGAAADHTHQNHHQNETGHAGGHSDIEVTQRLRCISNLSGDLLVPLMARFPAIEQLTVDWLTPTGQGHAVLTSGDSHIQLPK